MSDILRYWGQNKHGTAVGGAAENSPAEFVEEKFRAGWKELRLKRNGELVGQIDYLDGKRRWWVES
jgi:hypothetical protein